MNPNDLTDPIIRRLSPAARKQLGVQTAEEAMAAFVQRSEKDLQRQIVGILRVRGIAHINPAMCKKSQLPRGWPDFTIFCPGGKTIFIECKHGTGKLSDDQERVRALLLMAGYSHSVAKNIREALSAIDGTEDIRSLSEARAVLEATV